MADHLDLPPSRPLESRRARGGPVDPRPVDRRGQASKLRSQLDELTVEANLDDSEDDDFDPRIILKIDAATRLGEGPLASLDLTVLGEGRGWTYAVLSNKASRRLLRQVLFEYSATTQGATQWQRPANLADMIDNIEGIELYGPADRIDPELLEGDGVAAQIVDVVLWPSVDPIEAAARVSDVTSALNSMTDAGQQAEVVAVDSRPQTTVIRVSMDRRTLDEVARIGWVERMKPQLRAIASLGQVARAQAPQNLPAPAGTPIGVLDGLAVTANPLLSGRVLSYEQFPQAGYTFDGRDADHGTGVASIASWGQLDFVLNGDDPPQSFPLVNARVFDFDPERGELIVPGQAHVTLEAAIRWLVEQGVRIVNLSLNKQSPFVGLIRDELTGKLDELCRELNIVLVVSAGNRRAEPGSDWHSGYPSYLEDEDNRVAEPGDAALAVTVGAIARRDIPSSMPAENHTAVAPAGNTSPFSRTGPVPNHTRDGIAKPEFADDGGNMVHDHRSGSSKETDAGVAVVVATPPAGGQVLSIESGTSYSAPAVAREIAAIASRYPNASANRLRALSALSCRRPVGELDFADFDRFTGSMYGTPRAVRILESGQNTAVLVIDSEMSSDTTVLHELPVPYEFARGGSSRTLRVALAFDPPTRRSRREYLAGTMTVELVRGLDYDEVARRYVRQPRGGDPSSKLQLPTGRLRPNLRPGVRRLASSTLVCRDFVDGSWLPDDETYFLVVTHVRSPWSERQKAEYRSQTYALAVELTDNDRVDLDVHGLVQAELRARVQATRVRV